MTSSSRPVRFRKRHEKPGSAVSRLAGALAALLLFVGMSGAAFGQLDFLGEIADRISVSSQNVTLDQETQTVTWIGDAGTPLTAEFEGVQIFAESLAYDYPRGLLIAKGDVSIYKDGFIYKGQNIQYNIQNQEISATALRTALEPIYVDAQDFDTVTKDISVINAGETYFTTHDSVNPNYRIKAKSVEIYPEDRIVFHNLTAYAGNIPVFYFPYLSQPFDEELGYTFAPGYSSNWGAYLLNQYGTLVGDHSLVKYHFDLRSERGLAGGIDIISRRHRDNPNFGEFKFYYANDTSPDTSYAGTGDRVGDEIPPDNRYRVNLQHRIYLPGPEESTFYVDIDVNKVSDEFFYEDFFPNEFRVDPRPDNIVSLVKTHERGTLSLLTRFQVNDFFQTDTRLPELALDFTRQPVFNTGLFYEGTTSFGIYTEELADVDDRRIRERIADLEEDLRLSISDPTYLDLNPDFSADETRRMLDDLRNQIDGEGFTRFHSYHEILYPRTYGGWLNLTPRFGAGVTAYSDVDGPGDPGSETRGILTAGLDASVKFSRNFDDVSIPALGVDGVRHVAQPYVNYSVVSADDYGPLYPDVDRLVPSTRLRPIDVPQFTAIDDLADWNILRLGMRNTLFTRRDDRNYNWMGLNTYMDFYFDDPEFDRDWSNLFNDFYWRPLPWLRLNVDSQFPVGGGDYEFSEINSRVTFQPIRSWTFTLGHQWLNDHPFFEDSSLITFSTYTRLTENWGFGMIQRYEMDDSTLEVQQYSIHRDLTSWTASLGALIRDNRGEEEFGIIFALTLKDFPQVTIPLQLDPGAGRD